MLIAHIDGVPMKTGLSAADVSEAKAKLEIARAATKARAGELLKSIKAADAVAVKELSDMLLNGEDARLVSAFAANKKLKPDHRQTLERCLSVPSLLKFEHPLSELVPVHPKAKKSGGVRAIHNHGLLHRTAQDMVKRVMGAHYKPRYFQFSERGVHTAVKNVKAALGAGHVYVARLDIADFYPNFELEKLVSRLPLPKEVVENAVVGRHMKVVLDPEFMKGGQAVPSLPHTIDDLLLRACLGIPQGSACSPIVGSHRVSNLMWLHRDGVTLVNYADDFLLLSLSAKLLDEAVGGLTNVVAYLPGGHFDLKLKAEGEAASGFEFLGHHFQIDDGKLTTSPTEGNRQAVLAKLVRLDDEFNKLVGLLCVVKVYNKHKAFKVLAQIMAVGYGWLSAFSECDEPLSEMVMLSEMLKDGCAKLGVTPAEIENAIDPYMEWYPTEYDLS